MELEYLISKRHLDEKVENSVTVSGIVIWRTSYIH